MTQTIEKVARAIEAAIAKDKGMFSSIDLARAAIEALAANVTDEMCDRACDVMWGTPPDVAHVRAAYRERFRAYTQAAIRAALEE